ncbi:MAG: hypothetical protein JNM17_01360 [Archangium sp.]|nr:hypothetical protein [Archangium sp.]
MTRHLILSLALLLPFFPAAELTEAAVTPPSPTPHVAPIAPEAGTLALSTEKVIIFKDGHGLFVKAAKGVADSKGRVFTENVPEQAVLGTFWAVPDERPLRSTVAAWHESVRPKAEERSCLSTIELIRANPGKTLTLGLQDRELTAKVIEVLEASGTAPAPVEQYGSWQKDVPIRGGELVVVETLEHQRQVFPLSSIKTVSGRELITHCVQRSEVSTRARRLTFDFGPDAANKPVSLHMMYFTLGVRWIPTWRVRSGSGSKAELSLQAEILNEEEDFDAATVDLVVGVPSFKFAGTPSPISLEQTMRSAVSYAMPSLMNSNLGISNATFNLRSGERMEGSGSGNGADINAFARELGGESKQDFFVYPVKGLALARGARAVVPLWTRSVPQRHVYTVELTDNGAPSKAALQTNTVMHQLELTNDTDLPFTTGAAMITDGDLPLGQDLLAYTSPGGKTLVPITTALDLRAIQSTAEVKRIPIALTVDKNDYAQVFRRSTVTLSNLQRKAVTMRVSVSATGKIANATQNGNAVVTDSSDRVNSHSVVTWEVTLAPGARMDLAYDLSVYL